MSPDEISAMVNGDFLKSSLEIYAPLDGQGVLGNHVFINLAQSLNIVTGTTATQYITSTKHIDLQQNTKLNIFPNPTFESTNIRFELSNQSDIQLTIIDVNGREIAILANEELPSGEYHYTWSKANLPSGVYYCILNVNGKRLTQKLILQN